MNSTEQNIMSSNNTIINNWWQIKRKEIKKKLQEQYQHSSSMKTTDIVKIALNSGVGRAIADPQLLDNTKKALLIISQGQKPTLTKAHKSVTGFRLREGTEIGCKVTLRSKKLWDFIFQLVNINLPSITNFRGLSLKKFDAQGNYSFGIDDLGIFPYVPYEYTFKNQGIQITIVFKSRDQKENYSFLSLLNFPFQKN